jgi:hypothetical protein
MSAFLEDVRTSVIDPAYADILANIRTLEELVGASTTERLPRRLCWTEGIEDQLLLQQ